MSSRRKQQLIKLFSASSLVGQLCGGAFLAAQVLVDHRHFRGANAVVVGAEDHPFIAADRREN